MEVLPLMNICYQSKHQQDNYLHCLRSKGGLRPRVHQWVFEQNFVWNIAVYHLNIMTSIIERLGYINDGTHWKITYRPNKSYKCIVELFCTTNFVEFQSRDINRWFFHQFQPFRRLKSKVVLPTRLPSMDLQLGHLEMPLFSGTQLDGTMDWLRWKESFQWWFGTNSQPTKSSLPDEFHSVWDRTTRQTKDPRFGNL